MKELSLNILDIAENSVKAGATLITVSLTQAGNVLTIDITDDGCGMDAETVRRVTDPFYTTRTTRRVGLGLPLLKLEAEQTGGTLTVTSRTAAQCPDGHGTTVRATFHTDHIDCMPLGDVTATLVRLRWQKARSRLLIPTMSVSACTTRALSRWTRGSCGRCWGMCRSIPMRYSNGLRAICVSNTSL